MSAIHTLTEALKIADFAHCWTLDAKEVIREKCLFRFKGGRARNMYEIDGDKFWSELILKDEQSLKFIESHRLDNFESLYSLYMDKNWQKYKDYMY